MKKFFAMLLCLCFVFTVVLTGCGSSSSSSSSSDAATVTAPAAADKTAAEPAAKPAEKVNLKISCWGIETDPNSKIIKDAVKLYNEKNTSNATATVEFTEQEQYKTKIAAQMAGNEAPDIFNTWSGGFLKPFVKAGKVFSLSDALGKDSDWNGRYVSGILTPLSFDGKVYAVPLTQTVVCLFYNKEIFDKYGLKAPDTYADLKNIIATLNKNNVTPIALGNKAPWVGAMMSELIANRIGGSDAFNKVYDGSGTWEDPSYIEAGKVMQELVKLNAFPKGFNALDNDPARADFMNGKAGMHIMGSWAIQQMTPAGSPLIGKLDVCKFPAMDNGKGSVDNWLGQPDQSFAISENCKNKDAAVEFLKFLTDVSVQQQLSDAGNILATNVKVDSSKANPVALKVADLQKSMKELYLFYDVALGATIGNEYNNTIQAITAGKSPEDSFKKLQKFTEQNK